VQHLAVAQVDRAVPELEQQVPAVTVAQVAMVAMEPMVAL
jgi:hypothetical protein